MMKGKILSAQQMPDAGTFVHDELALGPAQVAHVDHGDVIASAHGVLEGVRMLHRRPAPRAVGSAGSAVSGLPGLPLWCKSWPLAKLGCLKS